MAAAACSSSESQTPVSVWVWVRVQVRVWVRVRALALVVELVRLVGRSLLRRCLRRGDSRCATAVAAVRPVLSQAHERMRSTWYWRVPGARYLSSMTEYSRLMKLYSYSDPVTNKKIWGEMESEQSRKPESPKFY